MSLNQIFNYESKVIRVAGTDLEPLFCAQDVCHALDIANASHAIAQGIPEDERTVDELATNGGVQRVLFLREPGLYRLIFRSTKPGAEGFRKWVFREVLPSVRRTGRYEVGEPTALDGEPGAEGVDVRLRSLLWITKALVQLGAEPVRAMDVASKAVPRLLGAAGGMKGGSLPEPGTGSLLEAARELVRWMAEKCPEGWRGTQDALGSLVPEQTPHRLLDVLRLARSRKLGVIQARTATAREWVFPPRKDADITKD